MRTSTAKIAMPQIGYAGSDISAAIEPTPAVIMPIQRPYSPPAQIENAAMSCRPPMMSTTQPQVLRLETMKCVSATKKLALSIAAIPQMTLRIATIISMMPAKSTHPAPSVVSFITAPTVDCRTVAPRSSAFARAAAMVLPRRSSGVLTQPCRPYFPAVSGRGARSAGGQARATRRDGLLDAREDVALAEPGHDAIAAHE